MSRSSTMLLAVPVSLVVGLLLVLAWPVPDATFGFGSVGTFSDGGGMPALLVVTPAKVLGLLLVWASTVAGAGLLGYRRTRRSGPPSGGSARSWVAAGALLLAGLLIVVAYPEPDGWFTYGSFTTIGEESVEPYLLVLTTGTVVGSLLLWAATMAGGYLAGRRGTAPVARALRRD